MAAVSASPTLPTVQRPAVQQSASFTSSPASPAVVDHAATAPILPSYPAVHHLRQLHPQLDDEQLLAIAHEALHPPTTPHQPHSATPPTFPPLSVIACPGSGKTLTLAARIAFFISHHRIPANRILAITFTCKAKAELEQRVASILQHERVAALAAGRPPPCSDGLRVCTFSSLAFRYVRRYAHKFGWSSSMKVVNDDKAMKRILRDIIEQAQATARQKMKGVRVEYQMKEEMEQKQEEEVEEEQENETGEGSRWDDQLDEEEMMRVSDEVEAQRSTTPPTPNTTTARPSPAAAVPALTSELLLKPFSQEGMKRLLNRACLHINQLRLRAGLVLKPHTASSSAYLQTPHHYTASDGPQLSEEDDLVMWQLLRAYDAKLHATAQLGKGDLTPALLALLRMDEAVLREVQSEWRAVFVDEVQDSSRSDIALMLALVGCERWKEVEKSGHGKHVKPVIPNGRTPQRSLTSHLCLVGDPQQSIYLFRGVDPLALKVMSNVLDQYGLVKLRLSSNYRSTQHIVNTAVAIIFIERSEEGAKRNGRTTRWRMSTSTTNSSWPRSHPCHRRSSKLRPSLCQPLAALSLRAYNQRSNGHTRR